MTSVFVFEVAELIGCGFLRIIACDMTLVEFGLSRQKLGIFLENKLCTYFVNEKN